MDINKKAEELLTKLANSIYDEVLKRGGGMFCFRPEQLSVAVEFLTNFADEIKEELKS